MKEHVFRLTPGEDLRGGIDQYVSDQNIKAGVVLTCVGNLQKAVLRMADESITKTWEGTFEIVSLVGTMESGNSHLHLSVSDKDGEVFGGHLKMGTLVGTTAEVAIGEMEGMAFKRKFDPETGFDELVVEKLD